MVRLLNRFAQFVLSGHAFLICVFFVVLADAAGAERGMSEWVHLGKDGKLAYKTTPRGDRIMDFSHAGYMGGGVALPEVPVKRTVMPSGSEDESGVIQAAINEVSELPLENGFRGAVLLAPGIYPCANSIRIAADGAVLRGSGSGEKGTVIKLTGTPHPGIIVGRERRRDRSEDALQGGDFVPAETLMAEDYVPSGTNRFRVRDASGFKVGDEIEIQRPVTEAWIRFMNMDDLVRDGRPQTWLRAGTSTETRRRISAISENTITVEVPLSDSFDAKYLNPPGARVIKVASRDRIAQAGIENLRIEAPPQAISHTQRHFTALRMNGEDCWVRDVVCEETMNSVGVNGQRITLVRVAVNRKARHEGSSKPAEFAPNGGQVLLDRCAVNADNVWFIATGARQSGPIVILNCEFRGKGRAESHQRWSTGMLYDNCRAPEGGFEFRNRGSMGSGHGWSMGWGVAWNCVAEDFIIQNPPGALNWLIGCIGDRTLKPRPFGEGPMLPEGTVDSHGTHVTPQGLYLEQLRERLGPPALRNIGYEEEIVTSRRPE